MSARVFFFVRTSSPVVDGHCDKQPPLTDHWAPGLHPYKPVLRDGCLYGRGGADDGYALFAAIGAIKCLQAQGNAHPRLTVLIEASEESGSPDLNHYLDRLKPRLGDVSLIICLDSGAGNYEHLWLTTSLRGVMNMEVRVDVLKNGVHSGAASGVVPSSMRCMREILNHLEDSATGRVLVQDLWVEVPEHRVKEVQQCAKLLGDSTWKVRERGTWCMAWTLLTRASDLPICRGCAACHGRRGRAAAQQDLAAHHVRDGRGRHAGSGRRRQRAARLHVAGAELSAASHAGACASAGGRHGRH